MENHHKQTCCSTDTFSFPSTPSPDHPDHQDSEFEFGSVTPDSPTTDQYYLHNNSPADHLFFNGKLLPHSFPLHQQQQSKSEHNNITDTNNNNINMFNSLTTSRTSSASSRSKGSFDSSRSNSSNGGSARTSSSSSSSYYVSSSLSSSCKAPMASKAVMAQLYGSSQRWQHITPVIPALRREDSRRSNSGNSVKGSKGSYHNKKKKLECDNDKRKKDRCGMCWKFLMWIVLACRVCHGMDTSVKDDILEDN